MTLQGHGAKPVPCNPRERPARSSSGAHKKTSPHFRLTARGVSTRRVGRRRGGSCGRRFRGNPRSDRAPIGAVHSGYTDGAAGLRSRRGTSCATQSNPAAAAWASREWKACGRCPGAFNGPGQPHVSRHRRDDGTAPVQSLPQAATLHALAACGVAVLVRDEWIADLSLRTAKRRGNPVPDRLHFRDGLIDGVRQRGQHI